MPLRQSRPAVDPPLGPPVPIDTIRFVARWNIARLRKLLAAETSPQRREVLQRLLDTALTDLELASVPTMQGEPLAPVRDERG